MKFLKITEQWMEMSVNTTHCPAAMNSSQTEGAAL